MVFLLYFIHLGIFSSRVLNREPVQFSELCLRYVATKTECLIDIFLTGRFR